MKTVWSMWIWSGWKWRLSSSEYRGGSAVDEGFETVTASCPVPIVMAGGKKVPALDALTMACNAVQQLDRIRNFGHDLNLGHLISHRAHRVSREKSKTLCDLCGLCERKGQRV
jgi:hypothetical protein